jgi:hypothetical protein
MIVYKIIKKLIKKILIFLKIFLADLMIPDDLLTKSKGIIPVVKNICLKEEQREQAIRKKMYEIVTNKGPELYDFRPTHPNSMFKTPSKLEIKEFFKKNKKAIKKGKIIVILNDHYEKKLIKKGIVYKNNKYNYIPNDYHLLSKEKKKNVLNQIINK